MQMLIWWDHHLFDLINASWQHPLLDAILPYVRNKYIWVPLYFFIVAWFFSAFNTYRAIILVSSLVTMVAITDVVSGQVLKKTIKRERPCNMTEFHQGINLHIPCRNSYAFPSAHAANHFAIATFLSLVLTGWMRIPLFIWAAVISYAQVYVGLHYPIDIVAGALLGTLIARIVFRLMTIPGLGSEPINPGTDNLPA